MTSIGARKEDYYGRQIEQFVEEESEYCSVPFDPAVPVRTYFDLGIGDSTAIWFAQFVGKEFILSTTMKIQGKGYLTMHGFWMITVAKLDVYMIFTLHRMIFKQGN